LQARSTRSAISPRLAMRILSNIVAAYCDKGRALNSKKKFGPIRDIIGSLRAARFCIIR
jgi:hypothetical protein